MERRPRILVVDDEQQIIRVLRTSLATHGYEVRTATDGLSALEIFKEWTPDLVLTDLMMPGINGLELCRRLRAISQVPILILSVKGEERAKVEALDIGADDYITKPFGCAELLARVRAALRRAAMPAIGDSIKVLEAGDFRVDLETRTVLACGRVVRLTPKEFDLLTFFMRNAGKVLTHRKLLSAVWGGSYTEQPEYLRVFIGNLRKKIEPDPSNPRYILTEHWVGYRFNPQGE
ncbi:response regulator transcription factor [Pyrinomonas methylaliphatogenes]|jgi:two-component system KDP operon response regulator KdpE|uniref:Response regulator with CheY-like receiver domain and winged-helix DNA-binding domain n=1 Tax=Pyrinomonas methylaliphatogenes TaxID=454194 RepID=A0A0B6X1B7_9BACT|nr:response regulator transcription factor [Pyrinomonas methylaliphatogenes]MBX5479762.1 response regulator transcription factor [Pyrinomonas methylaliphatogenes]CDM66160.1 response regulator with CheY-like receiver domain and winged-helix DNA-binding domain [Pyrinomonas methylaliphatogenes]